MYIGGSDESIEGQFEWTATNEGEKLPWSDASANWAPGQPDNLHDPNHQSPYQNCLTFQAGKGLLHDNRCSIDRNYLCETTRGKLTIFIG